MIVKVEWTEHNRKYSISLRVFLSKMGLDVDDEKITSTVKHLLEQNEMKDA